MASTASAWSSTRWKNLRKNNCRHKTFSPMITVCDKQFKLYMPEHEIKAVVDKMARQISSDMRNSNPLFVPILTGSYIFMADLARALDFDADIAFARYSSYNGMQSTGSVKAQLPFPERCRGRHVVIVEDIIDSGITMDYLIAQLQELHPASIRIATFLFKPDSFQKSFKIDYIGKSIPNDFIVGYGLDYNDFGRGYRDIYVVAD